MKTILITGTSSGIGKATALLFSEKGWNVAAAMRNSENFAELNKVKNINTYIIDVTEIKSIEKCIGQILQEYGKIDVVVNNAGVYTTNPLESTSLEVIDSIIKTNINGVLYMTKAILPHFRENKGGIIVNISSIAGQATFPFQSVYHVSKWAIEGLSEGLMYELNPLNIKMKIVEPGMVKTNLYRSVIENSFVQYPIEYANNFRNWHTYLMGNYEKGYNPNLDAKTIYKAVTDGTSRLRYKSDFNTKLVLFLRSIFSLSIFQNIITNQSKLKQK